jgi:hypothetical protein
MAFHIDLIKRLESRCMFQENSGQTCYFHWQIERFTATFHSFSYVFHRFGVVDQAVYCVVSVSGKDVTWFMSGQ